MHGVGDHGDGGGGREGPLFAADEVTCDALLGCGITSPCKVTITAAKNAMSKLPEVTCFSGSSS